MATTAEVNGLLEKLSEIASRDPHTRIEIANALRTLQRKLEEADKFHQNLNCTYMEITVTRIAEDLQVYRRLAEHAAPVTVAQLSAEMGAAPLLTRRLLRFLAAVGQIQETSKDAFAANDLTKAIARNHGVTYNVMKNYKPAIDALPGFLAENGYRDIADICRTPFQKAFHTDSPFFDWVQQDPKRSEPFNRYQRANEAAVRVHWFDVFPVEQELGSFAGPHVFVDVGGGLGQKSASLLKAFPSLMDKIIVQDLPQVIAEMPQPLEGIRAMAHNFFQEQPIKGAKFYYMHHILHDWPDNRAVDILRRLREACELEPGSQVLIDEIVLPNVGAHWVACGLDLLMMTLLAGRERTYDDWQALIEAAGFRIQKLYTYSSTRQDSVIQAVPI